MASLFTGRLPDPAHDALLDGGPCRDPGALRQPERRAAVMRGGHCKTLR